MQRLLIVSNRLPISVETRKNGLRFKSSVGGLATGLGSFYKSMDSLWIGWADVPLEKTSEADRTQITEQLRDDFDCVPVFLSEQDIHHFYHGFSNKTIWPTFHQFTQYSVFDQSTWEAYRRVNHAFCEAVVEAYRPGDVIWIHDYHLMLLPEMIRQRIPDATIGFFLHIPFPPFETFRMLPWRREILQGLLGADLVGFHTFDYVRYFLATVLQLEGMESTFGRLVVGERIVRADCFPMGIDFEHFSGALQDPKVQREVTKLRKRLRGRKMVLSVDRLDYTKGIPDRLKAFATFLERNPKWRGDVVMMMVAVPSRTRVDHYRLLKKQVDELVGTVNGNQGTLDWMPVWYLYRSLPFEQLVALYYCADVALVTPLRDGMNLVAKEYVAAKSDEQGVLVLSEMAGSAKELGEAICVNPNNREEYVGALATALTMPEEEQRERNVVMRRRLRRYNVRAWADDFVKELEATKDLQEDFRASRQVTRETKRAIADHYGQARKKLLLLDYDGTLVPFTDRPDMARPDAELTDMLTRLATQPDTEVVIISGRDKEMLQRWLGDLDIGLISEHGAWVRERGRGWEMVEQLNDGWKEQIRPILELYADRTPGAFVEEKDFTLVWHYRKTDPQLAAARSHDLVHALTQLTANLDLGVMSGDKIVEIKSVSIDKGRAATRWTGRAEWDFVLALGDDRTDEDSFAALPESAYTVKVGAGPSRARYRVGSVSDARALLRKLVSDT